jgi:hypothetical protein
MDALSVGGLPAPVVTLLDVGWLMLRLTALSQGPSPQVVRVPATGPRPLKPKSGAACPWCQDPLAPFVTSAPRPPIP